MYVDEKKSGELQQEADIDSVAAIIAWLETKDPIEEYDYVWHEECLAGQYLRANGLVPISDLWNSPYQNLYHISIGEHKEWTFGAALARAKQIQLTTASNSAI